MSEEFCRICGESKNSSHHCCGKKAYNAALKDVLEMIEGLAVIDSISLQGKIRGLRK